MRFPLCLCAVLVACSSAGEPAQPTSTHQSKTADPTDPQSPSDPNGDPVDPDDTEPPAKPVEDAGTKDGSTAKDAGPTGPAAFTKAELQTLVDDRCSPCHTDFDSGGMSLANDFTTETVGIASTELPSMKRIAKGDHTKSYLWHKVNGSHLTVGGSGVRMPKNGAALTATEIERLAKYIDGL
jgi:hypothetical protein